MTQRFVILLAACTILSTGALAAPAAMSGPWKLTLGHQAPCTLTMTDDGAVMPGADCSLAVPLAHWKGTSDGIQLQTAAGETYAVLKPRDGAYAGRTFADMRELTLSR